MSLRFKTLILHLFNLLLKVIVEACKHRKFDFYYFQLFEYIKQNSVGAYVRMYMRFNFFNTRKTSIKPNTIDHQPGVSVIRGFVTS